MQMERIVYLDHAATTRPRKEVIETMVSCLEGTFGNPSSLHKLGRQAKNVIEKAREQVASALCADGEEIYFTSGGSESDNWAIRGIAYGNREYGNHIITSCIEHKAVLQACAQLEREGFEITYLPVNPQGFVSATDVENAIKSSTILVSVMMANNEIGTIQPIQEIGKITRDRGVYFHTDAVQAVGSIPIDVEQLNVDLLSLSGHKFYGPKGIGVLYVRNSVAISPIIWGGGQEKGLRAGTENMPGIVGLGRAIELADEELDEYRKGILKMRGRLMEDLFKAVPTAILNGDSTNRLPGNVNISIPGINARSLLEELDDRGVAISVGSACESDSIKPSYVLTAIGLSPELANSSIRMTLGRQNTEEDIKYFVRVLKEVL